MSDMLLDARNITLAFGENDLLNIRNFGAKSIEEVKDKLQSMDLSLKM